MACNSSEKEGHFDENETLPYVNLNEFFGNDFNNKEKNIINSDCGFDFNLYPIHKRGITNKKIYEPYLFDKRNSKFSTFVKDADKLIEVKERKE